jgi:hypothetical protein
LFVQNGEERPKFRNGWNAAWSQCVMRWLKSASDGHQSLGSSVAHPSCNDAVRSDRYWLVECDSAEEGRETIRASEVFSACSPGSLPGHFVGPGRIIASGGRRPAGMSQDDPGATITDGENVTEGDR